MSGVEFTERSTVETPPPERDRVLLAALTLAGPVSPAALDAFCAVLDDVFWSRKERRVVEAAKVSVVEAKAALAREPRGRSLSLSPALAEMIAAVEALG